MSAVSRIEWHGLILASIAITKNSCALQMLVQKLTSQYTDSEMAEVWRQARMGLTDVDQCWLENELYRLFVQNSQDTAA